MTFQNSKISSAPNFEIIFENQTVYFSDYPDFPIFEKTIFPNEVWNLMEIDFDQLCIHLIRQESFLKSQYSILHKEFNTLDTPKERAAFLEEKRKSIQNAMMRFEELTDPEFTCRTCERDEINKEAHGLHLFIKYSIEHDETISDYKEHRMYRVVAAIAEQNYDFDPHTGEIINIATGETLQESQI